MCCIAYVYIRIYIHVSHCIVVVKVATNRSDVMKVMSRVCTTRYICTTPRCTHDVWYTPIIVASLGFPQFINRLTRGVYNNSILKISIKISKDLGMSEKA